MNNRIITTICLYTFACVGIFILNTTPNNDT
nr:MAG TPA: hypothetical protein [Ackermannviridae sp.]DAR64531.1 MAG TPA: hypothetical protein [Caudoviricetes sp.]